jgi:protein-S-isoprenylcysteine O-methyltransferase Ste14
MVWLPPIIVLVLFISRLIELRRAYPARPGKVTATWTFGALTAIGSATVISALVEYVVIRPAPSATMIALGLAAAGFAFALRAAARRALGAMWSVHVEIRDGHQLVDNGPYRFVRHPIYVAAMAELASVPLVLSAWRSGLFWLVVYAVALTLRVRAEETAMHDQLGDRWAAYCRRTGAFFPRW